MATANREEGLFAAALEKPTPAERAAYLEGACGGVLDSPPSAPAPTTAYPPLTEGPGTLIGPYKLLQQIGEGGMGVVYMAEQLEPVRRMVALKIIKPGMDSRQVIARFEAERQVLAIRGESRGDGLPPVISGELPLRRAPPRVRAGGVAPRGVAAT